MQAEQQGPGRGRLRQQQGQQGGGQARIEAGQGFIGQQQGGVLAQQASDRHPLPLAAGEGRHRLAQQLGGQVHPGQHGGVGGGVEGQQEVEQGPGPAPGRQPAGVEVLLHAELLDQAQVLPEGADAGLLAAAGPAGAGGGGALPEHLAGSRGQQPVGHREQGALAGAARAEQGHPLAGFDHQVHPLQPRHSAAAGHAQPPQLQQRRRSHQRILPIWRPTCSMRP